jgi:hypothetical protein
MLDNYEGHFPDRPAQSLFRRVRVTVTRADGTTGHAGARQIVDGDYRAAKKRSTG